MHLDFTTLFYANYAAKGVSLCRSLARVCADCHIYIFAMDDECYSLLQKVKVPYATIIHVAELEAYYPELLETKKDRNKGEYSWTCKGPSLLYCIEKFQLTDCTYLDADLYFFKDPTPMYLENPVADVMLTDHRYTKEYNLAETNGKYCAGYMYFKNTPNGMQVLRWWTNRCIEWCYSSHEEGRFGDQKYLDLFHNQFNNIYDIQHIGFCAPWNIQQYIVTQTLNGVNVCYNGQESELIFYHFHFLRNLDFGKVNEFNLGPYKYNRMVIGSIYKPYLDEIKQFVQECDAYHIDVDVLASTQTSMSSVRLILHWLKNSWKRNKQMWWRR